MSYLLIAAGIVVVFVLLLDTFHTIVVPRTVTSPYRLTRMYYLLTGAMLRGALAVTPSRRWRTTLLTGFAPLSLILLFVTWAIGLIFGFTLIHLGSGTQYHSDIGIHSAPFWTHFYFNGVTFLTLGYGDLAPSGPLARALAVTEAGVGFMFLAVVISYLPVMYQAFSRRENAITLLDARAGSPPTAGVLMRRYAEAENMPELIELLANMEKWAAELLEAYLSYPILAFYRSQHEDESWLSTLTAIMDACALIEADFRGDFEWQKQLRWQAHLTFAMARHTVVDLSQVIFAQPKPPPQDRLPQLLWERVCRIMEAAGAPLCDDEGAQKTLTERRSQYEPYVHVLAERLYLTLPPFLPEKEVRDNWETSAWDNKDHL